MGWKSFKMTFKQSLNVISFYAVLSRILERFLRNQWEWLFGFTDRFDVITGRSPIRRGIKEMVVKISLAFDGLEIWVPFPRVSTPYFFILLGRHLSPLLFLLISRWQRISWEGYNHFTSYNPFLNDIYNSSDPRFDGFSYKIPFLDISTIRLERWGNDPPFDGG